MLIAFITQHVSPALDFTFVNFFWSLEQKNAAWFSSGVCLSFFYRVAYSSEKGRMISMLNMPCDELMPFLLKKGEVPLTA